MIVRSGNAASFLVEFPLGVPDGNLTWKVLAEDGTELANDSVVVPVDATSINLVIPAIHNTLAVGELTGFRDVSWTYTVGGVVINGEARYTLEGRVPFGASADGVRTKLGADSLDVPDTDISLVRAYLLLEETVGAVPLAATALTATGLDTIRLRDTVEALAALEIMPTMPQRIALKESSGTDTYQRDKIDWDRLAASLQDIVSAGILVVVPTFDFAAGAGAIFILAGPEADAITGVVA